MQYQVIYNKHQKIHDTQYHYQYGYISTLTLSHFTKNKDLIEQKINIRTKTNQKSKHRDQITN